MRKTHAHEAGGVARGCSPTAVSCYGVGGKRLGAAADSVVTNRTLWHCKVLRAWCSTGRAAVVRVVSRLASHRRMRAWCRIWSIVPLTSASNVVEYMRHFLDNLFQQSSSFDWFNAHPATNRCAASSKEITSASWAADDDDGWRARSECE